MFRPTKILAVLVLAVAASLVTAAPATAVTVLTCTTPSSETITYDPELTAEPGLTTTTVSTSYGPCVAPNTNITSGSRAFAVTGVRSCLTLLATVPVVFTIVWDTGETSTLTGSATTSIVGLTLVSTHTGSVTSGKFAGATFVQQIVAPAAQIIACTLGAASVSAINGTVNLVITGL